MNLTDVARKELRDVLVRDFGEKARCLSDLEVDDLGLRLLKLTATALKRNIEASTVERRTKDFSLRP
jgi:hypothetical protein